MPIRKLVLFDIDGTLLKSLGATRAAKGLAIRDTFGIEVDVSQHPFGGKTDWQILRELLEPVGITGRDIGIKMPAYERNFGKRLNDVIDNFDVTALPGALDLVAALRVRADVLPGILTGNTSRTAPIKLRAAGFDPGDFVIGAFGSETDDRNILPKIALERACALTRQPLIPADVIIIGDTTADVNCARALGAVAVTVFTGFEARQNIINAQPDYLLEDLTQFMTMVPLS